VPTVPVEDRELRGEGEIGVGRPVGVFVVVLGVGQDVRLVDSFQFHLDKFVLFIFHFWNIMLNNSFCAEVVQYIDK
jgi:hypothetical protein